jgi:hypothetical protein
MYTSMHISATDRVSTKCYECGTDVREDKVSLTFRVQNTAPVKEGHYAAVETIIFANPYIMRNLLLSALHDVDQMIADMGLAPDGRRKDVVLAEQAEAILRSSQEAVCEACAALSKCEDTEA